MEKKYKEIVAWMANQLPMYQKLGKTAFNASLDNIILLDKHLKHPHKQFKSIHIAGTNGKGSTSHMLASILQEAGYKVGLYTSPHLKDYRERIRVNGKTISKSAVVDFIENNQELLKANHFSFFEMSVGMAFDYFAKEKIDFAIIETGLGGRLDSTNIIQPILSIITNIGMDHIGVLGNSLSAIAQEKAGIIKENTPVVIGETTNETELVFKNIATQRSAPLYIVDQQKPNKYSLDLKGDYQKQNTRTVLQAIDILKKLGISISEKAITNGLLHVVDNTGLMGRWQILNQKPLVVCDTAHNTHALTQVVKQIKKEEYAHLHIVLGLVSDKEIEDILQLLPTEATYYFCSPDINRALEANKLQFLADNHNLKGDIYSSVKKAYQAAIENSTIDDMIYIGGSNFVVAEIL